MKEMRRIIALIGIWVCVQGLFAQHIVVLKNGDKLKGVVMGIQNDVLAVVIDREMKEYQLVDVSSIFFNEHIAYDGSFNPAEKEKSIPSGDYVIKYQMKDRVIITPPVISNATENHGLVVVEVEIDKYGHVLKSKAGATGSTTTNEYLYIKAEFAAKGTRFDEAPKGPVKSIGTIIINY